MLFKPFEFRAFHVNDEEQKEQGTLPMQSLEQFSTLANILTDYFSFDVHFVFT